MSDLPLIAFQSVYIFTALITATFIWKIFPKSSDAYLSLKGIKAGGAFAAFLIVYLVLYHTGPLRARIIELEKKLEILSSAIEAPAISAIAENRKEIVDGKAKVYTSRSTSQAQPQKLPESPSTRTSGKFHNQLYTGLVVEVIDIPYRLNMAPKIVTEDGMLVYGPGLVEVSKALESGFASFYSSKPIPNDRVGSNPIYVRAISTSGNETEIVITRGDADKIITANRDRNFIREGKVAIYLTKMIIPQATVTYAE